MTQHSVAATDPTATDYADIGFAPIMIGKRDKRPTQPGWQSAPTDAAAVDRWLAHGGNVGLRMGEQPDGSRLIAIDDDEPGAIERAESELGSLPETLTSITAKGRHRIYAWPADRELPRNSVRIRDGIDIRSQGGQIVVAPSVHPSGHRYAWETFVLPVELPAAWVDVLTTRAPEPRHTPRAAPRSADPGDRVDQVIAIIEPHFCIGVRHELSRALGSWLATLMLGPWNDGEIEAVMRALPSEDRAGRVGDALGAAAQARGGAVTIGWQALSERIGADDAAALELAARSSWWVRFLARRPINDGAPHAANDATTRDDEDRTGYDPAVDNVIAYLAQPSLHVYQRAGLLVTIARDAHDDQGIVRPNGAPTIRQIVPARLKEVIRTTAGPREVALASEVIARGEWADIRPLDAIVSYPVVRRDGTILTTSGYDAKTRTLADISIRVQVPDVPTLADARTALEMLTGLVSDFPFATDAHRSSWLAALLTVPARPAIDGPTPMLLLDASARGSGKTLLADVISIVVTGDPAPRRTAPETAEEWRKVIFAMLLAGDPICLIDNVTRMLASAALDAMLTGTTYQDRVLGVSEERRIPVRTVMIASANNCRVSTDLVRRSVHCRLEPDVEHPESRTGFRHADLLGHVRRERSALLGAALTIVRAYAVAGRPRVDSKPMGSYTAWCRVVRDALVWAGAADPAATQDGLSDDADVERDELRDLLTAWHARLGDRAVTVKELLDAANNRTPDAVKGTFRKPSEPNDSPGALLDALRGIMPLGVEPSAHAIGHRLRTLRNQITGGLALRHAEHADSHTKVKRWQVK